MDIGGEAKDDVHLHQSRRAAERRQGLIILSAGHAVSQQGRLRTLMLLRINHVVQVGALVILIEISHNGELWANPRIITTAPSAFLYAREDTHFVYFG
jgi:hypothetical protein